MKAMMEQFRATETAMRLSELKVNVCYLGLTPKPSPVRQATGAKPI